MKITKTKIVKSKTPQTVVDCFVDKGYIQGTSGSLPDVDQDFQSDRRQDVKAYIERRYNHDGKQRVFSAGTFTTLKVKAVIKDVARTMRLSPSMVNYLTAVFEDDKATWTDIFKLATQHRKIAKFIRDYPQLFEDIRSLMFQPRSSSIHASALLVTPDELDGEDVECFDFVPIKKVDDILVSEDDGYALDELGLLKNDCLATKELSKLHSTFSLIKEHYNDDVTMEDIVESDLDDPKVYDLLSHGYTQNVFQFSSKGITAKLKEIEPACINDLIAANALYRPATLENGSVDAYIDCKAGNVSPVYLWGTYNALKETYAQMVYQEQMVQIAREVGGFSLGEGVKLVKFISKKKIDKIKAMKDKFMAGAKKNGCPDEDATKIWEMIESGGSYLFNKCISGKERIKRLCGACGRWEPTIAEMYRVMHDKAWAYQHGHQALYEKYHRKGYGYAWSMKDSEGENPVLVKHSIKDIRYMGVRPVYRITLENGATIDVTNNHKHPIVGGIKRTDELVIGKDKMYYCVGHHPEDTVYRFTDKDGAVNNPYYHTLGNEEHYVLNSEPGHEGFLTRDSHYTRLVHYKNNLKKDHCELCGATSVKLEVHHINGDHSDVGEGFNNVQTLCVSCHKKVHYQMGRKKMGEKGLCLTPLTVASIEYIGDDEVYDVEMNDPLHTFTNHNGIVTCNSHATAYAVTSYVGAWLKANYPTAFYTVALEWADDKELVPIMWEMEACSKARVVPPDINHSRLTFYTDYETDTIFWSLSRIKQVGTKAVDWMIDEREKNGEFTGIVNFIDRVFKYKRKKYEYWDDPENEDEVQRCPVNARHIKNLILAGCFDKVERAESVIERYAILKKAATELGFEIKEDEFPEDLREKHYFWSQQQIKVSGVGAIDYRRAFDTTAVKDAVKKRSVYRTLKELQSDNMDGKKAAICASVIEIEERKYTSKKTGEVETFCKLTLQQNNEYNYLIIWPEQYQPIRELVASSKGKIIAAMCKAKWSSYSDRNELWLTKHSIFQVL